MAKKRAEEPRSYREAAAEIDQILERIDQETEVDIDELADQVERAAGLIRFCFDRLRSAELRVQRVTEELAEATASAEDPPAGDPSAASPD